MPNDLAEVRHDTPPEVAGSASVLQVIERAASDPNVDVDKMQRLLDMHERILNRNAEQAYSEAMTAAQNEMEPVVRDAYNEQPRSRYATLERVNRAIKPIITKHGFSLSFGTAESHLENHYRITCTVSHTGGHSREYHADVPADMTGMKGNQNKTATHGFGSTMSYGRRYLTQLIFNVSLTDDDDDGNAAGSEPISADQKQTIIDLLRETDSDTTRFLKYIGAKAVDEIPAAKYEKAVQALEKKRGAA